MPGIRYIAKFAGHDGLVYQLQMIDADYGGVDPELEFPLESILYPRGRKGVHLFTPILGSSIDLVGWKLTEDALDELLGAEVGRFTGEIWRGADHATIDGGGGEFYWKGIVQTDLGEDDTARQKSDAKITATDGLQLLRDELYLDLTGEEPVDYTGRETHLTTLRNCLAKIGYTLPISVSAHWYPEEGESGDILWEHAETDVSIFYSDDGTPANCYDVLKQLLYPYVGVMFWREGRFVVIQKSQLGAATYTVNDYDAGGSLTGTTVMGNTIDTSTGARLEGDRSPRYAFGGASIYYNHGNIPPLIRNGGFIKVRSRPPTEPDDYWGFGGSGGEVRLSLVTIRKRNLSFQIPSSPSQQGLTGGRVELRYCGFVPAFFFGSDTSMSAYKLALYTSNRFLIQLQDDIEIGDRIAFTGRCRVPWNAGNGNGLYNPMFSIGTVGGTEWMNRDGTWSILLGENRLQGIFPEGDEYNDWGVKPDKEGSGWTEFAFISEPAPEAGQIWFQLYGVADENGSDLDPEGVEWDDLSVDIVDETGELRDSTVYVGTTPRPEPADEDLVVLVGQGPRASNPGHITWDGEYAGDWTTDGESYEELGLKLLRTRLGYQSARLEVRFEAYRGIDYEFGDVLDIGGDLYFPVWHEKDIAAGIDRFEAVRILFDDSIIEFETLPDDLGSYTFTTPGAAAPAAGNAATNAVIKAEGDLIVGDSDGVPSRLPVTSESRRMLISHPDGEGEGPALGYAEYSEPEDVFDGSFVAETPGGVAKRYDVVSGRISTENDIGDRLIWPDGETVIWPGGGAVILPD